MIDAENDEELLHELRKNRLFEKNVNQDDVKESDFQKAFTDLKKRYERLKKEALKDEKVKNLLSKIEYVEASQ